MTRASDRSLALAVSLLASAIGAATWSAFAFDVRDEGYLYYVADAINRGETLYTDIELRSYLPGPFQLFGTLFNLCGVSIAAARVVMVVGYASTAAMTFLAARRFASPLPACVAAIVIAIVPGPWQKFYVGTLQIALLLGCFAVIAKASISRAVVLGGLVGLAGWLRVDSAIAALGLVALVLWRTDAPKRVPLALNIGIGVLLASAPWLGWLYSEGLILEYTGQLSRFVASIFVRTMPGQGLPAPAFSDLASTNPSGLFAWSFFGGLLLIFGAMAAALATAVRKPASDAGRSAAVLAFWLLSNLPQFALERPDMSHLTQRGVALAIAGAYLITHCTRAFLSSTMRISARAVGVSCALYAAFYTGKHLWFGEGGAYLYRGRARLHTLSNGMRFPTTADAETAPLVEALLARSTPGAPVGNWPYRPGLNFLAQKAMPGRGVFLIPENASTALQLRATRALEEEGVDHVFYAPEEAIHQTASSTPEKFMPIVHVALRRDYQVVARHGAVELLERRKRTGIESNPRTLRDLSSE